MFVRTKYYFCRHCGKKHKRVYMAEICFDLDMKILNAKKLIPMHEIRQNWANMTDALKVKLGL